MERKEATARTWSNNTTITWHESDGFLAAPCHQGHPSIEKFSIQNPRVNDIFANVPGFAKKAIAK
jgi:hypothetical protein